MMNRLTYPLGNCWFMILISTVFFGNLLPMSIITGAVSESLKHKNQLLLVFSHDPDRVSGWPCGSPGRFCCANLLSFLPQAQKWTRLWPGSFLWPRQDSNL